MSDTDDTKVNVYGRTAEATARWPREPECWERDDKIVKLMTDLFYKEARCGRGGG
jgi:hypothetical protein